MIEFHDNVNSFFNVVAKKIILLVGKITLRCFHVSTSNNSKEFSAALIARFTHQLFRKIS